MSEPTICPDCGGSGEERFGPFVFACRFCYGSGEVGGDHEHAEDPEPAEGYSLPVWESPAVAGLPGCRRCLGAGVVVHADTVSHPARIAELPCPACSQRK